MIEAWPCERLSGFSEGFHLEWTHLYCARAKCWFHDNYIYAFTMTPARNHSTTTIFLPQLKTPAPDKGKRIPPLTLSVLAGDDKDFVFIPMNINDSNWTCLVVDHPRNTIYCYHSLDKPTYHTLLEELAEELVERSMPKSYAITTAHSPVQKDSDNCGFFVCLYILASCVQGSRQ